MAEEAKAEDVHQAAGEGETEATTTRIDRLKTIIRGKEPLEADSEAQSSSTEAKQFPLLDLLVS